MNLPNSPDENAKVKRPQLQKRGAQVDPPNRFEKQFSVDDWEQLEYDEDARAESQNLKTQFITDNSRTILTTNDSPDVGFTHSVNPYRGCEHGCTYCYARPTHETLGMNAGSDFESKIMVKTNAPELLREALLKQTWQPTPIAMSGVTDCYQPAERRFRLTRGCLEVLAEFRNPVFIISKNVLMLRDLDILTRLAKDNLVRVYISVTTLRPELTLSMEPRTALPAARLAAVRKLRDANIPVGVMMAPVIPGLTDAEIPQVLAAAAAAGAQTAGYVPLRLPLNVKPIFLDWLERSHPEAAPRVISRIKEIRGGVMNDSNFNSRMAGEGQYAKQMANVFQIFAKRFNLDNDLDRLNLNAFRRSYHGYSQGELFSDEHLTD